MDNGEILDQIDCLLKGDDIDEKAALRLVLSFMKNFITEDHERILKMWPYYRGAVWVGAALGLSVLALVWAIITHQVTIIWP